MACSVRLCPARSLAACYTAGVGKSCLILRYTSNKFSTSYITTIGIDFKSTVIDIGGKRVGLDVSSAHPRGRHNDGRANLVSRRVSRPPMPADLGHGGAGAFSNDHEELPSRRQGHHARVRRF